MSDASSFTGITTARQTRSASGSGAIRPAAGGRVGALLASRPSVVDVNRSPLPQIRVLICDDHPVYRLGLRVLFSQIPDITLIGEARDLVQAWNERRKTRPSVLIVGQNLVCDAIDRLRRFDDDGVGVVVLAESDDERRLLEALRAGARGYLPRQVSTQGMVDGIRTVFAQGTALEGSAADHLVHPREPTRASPSPNADVFPWLHELTARQREVARLVAEGLSNAEVAARLYVSQATVKSHLTIILKRLNLRDRTQLAILVNRSLHVDSAPPGWSV